jgi:hypothetical protein
MLLVGIQVMIQVVQAVLAYALDVGAQLVEALEPLHRGIPHQRGEQGH